MFCWVYITGNMEYVILTASYPKQVVQWKLFKNLFKKPIQELSLHRCTKHDYWMLCWEVITCDINCWHFASIWAIFELWTSTTSENNWTFTTIFGLRPIFGWVWKWLRWVNFFGLFEISFPWAFQQCMGQHLINIHFWYFLGCPDTGWGRSKCFWS